ncbi:hypothetical protein JCM10213_008506 [Rhodosporidiobolus nylandii]
MATPANKGKARAEDVFERSDELERAPLLAHAEEEGSGSTPRKQSRLRHGRGPLVRDDSDDDDELLNNASEDDRMRYVVVAPQDSPRRMGWGGALCLFLSALFCLLLLIVAVLHLWVGHLLSEQARHGTTQEMAERGLLWTGPSAVRVQAGENGAGLMIEVDGTAGMDVRKALGWEAKDTSGWMRRVEGKVARWGIRKARSVDVDVGEVALYGVDDLEEASPLIVIPALNTLRIPLSYPTAKDPLPSLQPFTLRVPLTFPSPQALARFGEAAWQTKQYRIHANVRETAVKVGDGAARGVSGWFIRRMSRIRLRDLTRNEQGDLPALPDTSDPMSMVRDLTYTVFESISPSHPNTSVIAVSVGAQLKNPLDRAFRHGRLPPFAWGVPFRLPVSIHLPLPPSPQRDPKAPTDVTLAKVATAPFFFPLNSHFAQLAVSGHLVPAGNLTSSSPTPPTPPVSNSPSLEGVEGLEGSTFASSTSSLPLQDPQQPLLSQALSHFVKRFLSGRTNDIYIRYDPSPEPPLPSEPSSDAPFPPDFVGELLKKPFHVELPGTDEKPDFFQNLAMRDMRIKLGGGEDGDADLLASGRVVGEVVLPDAAKKLEEGIDAKTIWPDVLVYDGDLPGHAAAAQGPGIELEHDLPSSAQLAFSTAPSFDDDSAPYPPSPLPANAFARMRPSSSMAAETIHIPGNATHNATTIVSATFQDAPLYLLPGRGDVLRRFIAKIVFGAPGAKVKASMAGMTSVRVKLSGFGEVELEEIPIEASFMVGRGGVENPPFVA